MISSHEKNTFSVYIFKSPYTFCLQNNLKTISPHTKVDLWVGFSHWQKGFFWQRDSSYFLLSDAFAEGENRTHKTIHGYMISLGLKMSKKF